VSRGAAGGSVGTCAAPAGGAVNDDPASGAGRSRGAEAAGVGASAGLTTDDAGGVSPGAMTTVDAAPGGRAVESGADEVDVSWPRVSDTASPAALSGTRSADDAGCAIAGIAAGAGAASFDAMNGVQLRITHVPEPMTASAIAATAIQNPGPGAPCCLDDVAAASGDKADTIAVGWVPGLAMDADSPAEAAGVAATCGAAVASWRSRSAVCRGRS
jgi:hypothetical protein